MNALFADYFEPDMVFVLSRLEILPGSIASEWNDVILGWLGAKAPLTLKWRSEDASDVEGFHSSCDGVANTFVIVKSAEGNVFGGFAVPAWEKCGGTWKSDPTALGFLFVLKNSFDDPPTRYRLNGNEMAIYCHMYSGPYFGAGSTLAVWNYCGNVSEVLYLGPVARRMPTR